MTQGRTLPPPRVRAALAPAAVLLRRRRGRDADDDMPGRRGARAGTLGTARRSGMMVQGGAPVR